MSGCRGGWGLPVHTLWLCSKHSQPALSQEGADRGLVPCLRVWWGNIMKTTKRNVPSRHVIVYCFIEIFSDSVKPHTNMEKARNPSPMKVLEQCWLLLGIILKPNLTILWVLTPDTRALCFLLHISKAWTLLKYSIFILGFFSDVWMLINICW